MNFLKKIILVLIFLFPISNSFGAMVTLVDNLNVSEPIRDKIRLEFKSISKLLDLQNLGSDVFKRWYIDGRVYYHVIVDENNLEKGIHELRILDPRKIKKIREKKSWCKIR